MTTQLTFKDGNCGRKSLRIKQWQSGFSIKCLEFKNKTLMGMPFSEEALKCDLRSFCYGCERISVDEKSQEEKP